MADSVSPVIASEGFPGNLPPFDLVLSAGDMPAEVLEHMADRLQQTPVHVLGNHGTGRLPAEPGPWGPAEPDGPGGCIDAHARVVHQAGLIIVGFEGSARYRPGPYQYTEGEYARMVAALTPWLLYNRWRYGRAVDILLTHAPPTGPHAGTDLPHRGIPAFERFNRRWRPRLHVHGHVHLIGANAPREYVTAEGVRVINAFGFTLIDL